MHERTLIIGAGEVGLGLRAVLEKEYVVVVHDPSAGHIVTEGTPEPGSVMHICFPWSDQFDNYVDEYLKRFRPSVCIIHSTVPVECLPIHYAASVYSPVRGVHPNLEKGIQTFVKIVSGSQKETVRRARDHLEKAGIQTVEVSLMEAVLSKLLDTTYYGVCIAFAKYAKELCDKTKCDYEKVYTDFNRSYNAGYTQLGKPEVVRPVLYPPEKSINGHCVVENSKLLQSYLPSPFLDMIQDINKITSTNEKS